MLQETLVCSKCCPFRTEWVFVTWVLTQLFHQTLSAGLGSKFLFSRVGAQAAPLALFFRVFLVLNFVRTRHLLIQVVCSEFVFIRQLPSILLFQALPPRVLLLLATHFHLVWHFGMLIAITLQVVARKRHKSLLVICFNLPTLSFGFEDHVRIVADSIDLIDGLVVSRVLRKVQHHGLCYLVFSRYLTAWCAL